MPTYTYKCTACGHRFDGVAKMMDPNPRCAFVFEATWPGEGEPEKCGGPTEKVIMPGAAVQFVGRGWAKDGYSKGKA